MPSARRLLLLCLPAVCSQKTAARSSTHAPVRFAAPHVTSSPPPSASPTEPTLASAASSPHFPPPPGPAYATPWSGETALLNSAEVAASPLAPALRSLQLPRQKPIACRPTKA